MIYINQNFYQAQPLGIGLGVVAVAFHLPGITLPVSHSAMILNGESPLADTITLLQLLRNPPFLPLIILPDEF